MNKVVSVSISKQDVEEYLKNREELNLKLLISHEMGVVKLENEDINATIAEEKNS